MQLFRAVRLTALSTSIAIAAALAVAAPASAAPAETAIGVRDAAAAAAAPDDATLVVTDASSGAPTMRTDYSQIAATEADGDGVASQSAAAAPTTPELDEAIRRDLGIEPHTYLEQAAASADASDVLDWLDERGVDVVGSHLDGTTLVVSLPADADASTRDTVAATGATVSVDAPVTTAVDTSTLRPAADIRGGQGYVYFSDSTHTRGERCSVGFTGFAPSGGDRFITAGHCYDEADGGETPFRALVQSAPVPPGSGVIVGDALGEPVDGSFRFGSKVDGGLVDLVSGWSPKGSVATWGGGTGSALSGTPLAITATADPIVNQPVCKSGATTGWTCGVVLAVDETFGFDDEGTPIQLTETFTSACALSGDSGGSNVTGSLALGVTSLSGWVGSCNRAAQENPTMSFWKVKAAGSSATNHFGSAWEPRLTLATPQIKNPSATVWAGSTVYGTVADATAQTTVEVRIDGGAPASVSVGSGSWRATLPASLTPGAHTLTATAVWGAHNRSATASQVFTVAKKPAVSRIGGVDRIDTAIRIARSAYPEKAPIVYVATALNFPDALSAAPAAAHLGGPLLLTDPGMLDPKVEAAIRSLRPDAIRVVGSELTLSSAVENGLDDIAPTIRIGGTDRYDTSRKLIADAFTEPVASAYLATGTKFPDALSAAAAAGSKDVPVLLVDGDRSSLDQATTRLLQSTLSVDSAVIVGDELSVSAGIQRASSAIAPTTRLAGVDRQATSNAINDASFTTASTVYFATGNNFPDALAGAAIAGAQGAPLYVVNQRCSGGTVNEQLVRFGTTSVVLLGSENTLPESLTELPLCI